MSDRKKIKPQLLKRDFSYKKSCPFIEESFSECYCNSMNSLQAKDALYYCAKNYVECPIYKKRSHLNLEFINEKSVNR